MTTVTTMKIKMNDTRKAVLDVLANAEAPMTLAEISAAAGMDVKTGSINALVTAGVINKAGTKSMPKVVKAKVGTYRLGSRVASEIKDFKMTDVRKAVLDTLTNATDSMTLAEISEAVGAEVKSGTVNALVSLDLVEKGADKTVERMGKSTVNTYVLGDLTKLNQNQEA